MSNRAARSAPTAAPKIGFWKQRWINIEPAAGALIEDGVIFLIFVAVLTVSYLALGVMAGLGYKPERVETIETIHYYTFLAAFTTWMFDFVIRVVLHVVFGKKA